MSGKFSILTGRKGKALFYEDDIADQIWLQYEILFVWIKNVGYYWRNPTWCCNVDCYLCRKGRGKESVSAFFTDQWMAEGPQAKGTEKVREKNVYEYKWDKVLRIEIQSCSQLYYILGNLLDREYKKVEKASFTGQWSRIRKKFNQSGRRIFPPRGVLPSFHPFSF